MTVRELIDGLEHLCEKFGNDMETYRVCMDVFHKNIPEGFVYVEPKSLGFVSVNRTVYIKGD